MHIALKGCIQIASLDVTISLADAMTNIDARPSRIPLGQSRHERGFRVEDGDVCPPEIAALLPERICEIDQLVSE